MKTSVERLEGDVVKLTVTVGADEVDRAIAEAYKKIGGKVRIPGFRQGKAPRAVVDNAFGRENVLAEATEDLVNSTYPRAIDGEDLRPIEAPEMADIDSVVPGADYTYEAEVTTRPELTLASLEELTVEVPTGSASDEEVDAQIDQFRERMASLEPVEDRAAQENDFLLLSFVGTVDGEPYEGNTVDKYLYEMNAGLMPPEFDAGLVGIEAAGETRIEFEVPDTSSNPDFVGKTAEFDVTVHEIKQKVLPPVDDELAVNLGGFDTLEELRDNVRQGLETQKKFAFERQRERAIREVLAARLVGDVPEPMIKEREGRLYKELESSLNQREMSLGDYLAATGLTEEGIQEDIAAQAVQLVREDLALEALFRQQGWEVTDEDVDAELAEMAGGSKESPEQLRQRWIDMGLITIVREENMHRRAVDWLRENVTVVETDANGNPVPAEGTKPTKKKASKKKADVAVEDVLPEPAGEFPVEPETADADTADTE